MKTVSCACVLQIWVHSSQNASGYFSVFGEENVRLDHFSSRLSFGDTQTVWARTGYLGFLRRTELTDASGGECIVLRYILTYILVECKIFILHAFNRKTYFCLFLSFKTKKGLWILEDLESILYLILL